ncbi:penicillin-binding protein 2 [Candidatus Saccharibacteria bacterium]|nr:penicillin-binding protein 2 [Candidatus Saccharibacteria bacterium]MBH2007797.1 penicillin-binding protein 2 [Candidatus Saccharibacteria bacterium]
MPHALRHITRSGFLAMLLTGAMVVIVLRLFFLQVIQHDHYVALATEEQVKKLVIPASRGTVYALDGDTPVPLVMNQQVYTLFADPMVVDEPTQVAQVVRDIAGGNLVVDNIEQNLTDGKKQKSMYRVLAKNVTLRQAELIKDKDLKGIGFQRVSKRVYPEGAMAAQTLGFVNNEGKGQYGIEQQLNDRLTGTDGILKSVTDVANVPLSIGKDNIRQEPVNGDNLVLTIDRNIQAKAQEALLAGLQRSGATHGSVLVMDPATGKVLALADFPTYSPADFTNVQDEQVFRNIATTEPYEPGSVLKTFTIATGIDKGVIDANSTFYNTDKIKVEDRTITNALKGVTGTITMQSALNNSLNTGMVTIAQRLGDGERINKTSRDTIYEYFHNRLGLGERTGVEIANEQKGILISPEEEQGNAVRYSNMAFGQGLNVTMMQVASGFSAIINGGTYHSPTVLAGTYDGGKLKPENNSTARPNVISPGASAKAKEMIHQARVGYTNTDTPGYYIGGKTGTSQTLENGEYINSQTVGTYLGFGGTDAEAKYVIMVQVSGKNMNLEGNKHAMPIFTDLSNWMLGYYQLQPRA